MLKGRFHSAVKHDRRGGKNDGIAISDQFVDLPGKISTGRNNTGGCLKTVAELFLRLQPAEIMPVVPGGILDRAIEKKRGFDF